MYMYRDMYMYRYRCRYMHMHMYMYMHMYMNIYMYMYMYMDMYMYMYMYMYITLCVVHLSMVVTCLQYQSWLSWWYGQTGSAKLLWPRARATWLPTRLFLRMWCAAATLLQPLVHGLIATLGEMSTARPASLHRLCSTVARCMPPFNPMILSAGNL